METQNNWIALSWRKPPIGMCLEVTVKEHYMEQRTAIRYPVYYLQRPDMSGYSFYWGDFQNALLPDVSEVIAWKYMDRPYEPKNGIELTEDEK